MYWEMTRATAGDVRGAEESTGEEGAEAGRVDLSALLKRLKEEAERRWSLRRARAGEDEAEEETDWKGG